VNVMLKKCRGIRAFILACERVSITRSEMFFGMCNKHVAVCSTSQTSLVDMKHRKKAVTYQYL